MGYFVGFFEGLVVGCRVGLPVEVTGHKREVGDDVGELETVFFGGGGGP